MNGATISRSLYADLFAQIGTLFGVGDGATTFRLPDLRGEFIRGLDDARGIDYGRGIGTSQSDAVQDHGHRVTTGRNDSTAYHAGGGTVGHIGISGGYTYDGKIGALLTTGGGSPRTAVETRPRNVALLYCIKY